MAEHLKGVLEAVKKGCDLNLALNQQKVVAKVAEATENPNDLKGMLTIGDRMATTSLNVASMQFKTSFDELQNDAFRNSYGRSKNLQR